MKSYLTFDYELFFGANSGSVEKSIIEPTENLLSIANRYGSKLIFFVDAGYLVALNKNKNKYPILSSDYSMISKQLDSIVKQGHEIQLHIHPHWQDSYFNSKNWIFDTKRYKLDSFSESEVIEICVSYKNTLANYTYPENIFAYRAGGWCIQPFNKISSGLKAANVWLDSTIYQGGINHSATKGFDFRNSCTKDIWRFENNPLVEDKKGGFVELPISNIMVSPMVYWKIAFSRINKSDLHTSFGDGSSLSSGTEQLYHQLTRKTNQPIFLDGIKSSFIFKSYKFFEKKKKKYFVAIGHPKAMSKFSLTNIDLLMNNQEGKFRTFKMDVNIFTSI